jgi:hypothetical protein
MSGAMFTTLHDFLLLFSLHAGVWAFLDLLAGSSRVGLMNEYEITLNGNLICMRFETTL